MHSIQIIEETAISIQTIKLDQVRSIARLTTKTQDGVDCAPLGGFANHATPFPMQKNCHLGIHQKKKNNKKQDLYFLAAAAAPCSVLLSGLQHPLLPDYHVINFIKKKRIRKRYHTSSVSIWNINIRHVQANILYIAPLLHPWIAS